MTLSKEKKEAHLRAKIENKIYLIRGKKVMLDRDLAELYGVPTFNITRQVQRNLERFPKDFMYLLSNKEVAILRRQIGVSSWGGNRYRPKVFTQEGVAMF